MYFSVLVPVYNVEKYLPECVQSVLSQTFQDFELVLIDDGSTDSCGKLCDDFAASDSRIHVFHKTNGGLLSARRYALEKAQGAHYVFLDSDDYLRQDALEIIADAFETYDSDCVVYGWDRVSEGKTVAPYRPEFPNVRVIDDKREILMTLFCGEGYNSLCRKAVKASVIHDFDFSQYFGKVSCGEDRLQTIEIAKNAQRFVFLPVSLYRYRTNLQSMTNTKDYSGFSKDFTVGARVLEYLQSENVFSQEDWITYRSYCLRTLLYEVTLIARSATTRQNRKRIFNEIRHSDYYRNFLLKKTNRKILGKYRLIFPLLMGGGKRTASSASWHTYQKGIRKKWKPQIVQSILARIRIFFANRNDQSKAEYLREAGSIIGKNFRMVSSVLAFGREPYLIKIGDNCAISSDVHFFTHDGSVCVLSNLNYFGPGVRCDKMAMITVGDNCCIGANALIMPGVTIGNNVIIGAGAVVTKDIPDNSIACGVPAKVLCSIDEYYEKNKGSFYPTAKMTPEAKKEYYTELLLGGGERNRR